MARSSPLPSLLVKVATRGQYRQRVGTIGSLSRFHHNGMNQSPTFTRPLRGKFVDGNSLYARSGVGIRPSSTSGGSGAAASGTPKPAGSEGGEKVTNDPTMRNIVMALGLFGFVTSVFFYSLNAVGRGEELEGGELDPLARLKAEAQEAREMEKYKHQGRMSQEEIHELETGRSSMTDDTAVLEAALEEEANMKAFGDDSDTTKTAKKKKPWWRFGF